MSLTGSFSAAAFAPANPPEMTPLQDPESPARQAARLFRRGICLGNYLEALPEWPPVTYSREEFAFIKGEGFDHVRVPVRWQNQAGPAPDFKLAREIFGKVDFAIEQALANELAVIIDVHHFDDFNQHPEARMDIFLALWRQIADYYREYPQKLAFEVFNEPHETATTNRMNPLYARAIAEIRQSNPRRTLFVQPGDWGSMGELENLVLPPDDNLIVSVHSYEPLYFTHQLAPWVGEDGQLAGLNFPGPPPQPLKLDPSLRLSPKMSQWLQQYNTLPAEINPCSAAAFDYQIKLARDWSDYYGYPVYLGEFGCYRAVDPQSRANYCAAFRREADKQGLGWALWSWSSEFRYWDQAKNQPLEGMRAALFG